MRLTVLGVCALVFSGCAGCGETSPLSDAGGSSDAHGASSPDGAVDASPAPMSDASAGPLCGNGTVETGETCDGDCPSGCDDGDGCTTDTLQGDPARCTARCEHVVAVSACVPGDGCCAAGCDRTSDEDCPYYVDATGGDDAKDGLTPRTAWKTVAKVNGKTFVPGDRIAFKRGEVWREPLVIRSAGTREAPIVFTAYGSAAARPAIAPVTEVGPWSAAAGSTFVASLRTEARQVFVDGKRLSLARHPNQGYLYVDQDEAKGSTSFVDADLAASRDQLLGAQVAVRAVRWSYDVRTIVDFADHRVTFDSALEDWGDLDQDEGYFLANKLWMLDAPGEWFYDAAAQQLHLRLPDDSDPNGHVIEVSTADDAIAAKTSRGLVVENLEARQAGEVGIRLTAPSDTRVQGCVASGSGTTGLLVDWPPAGAVVEVLDNVVRDSAAVGLQVSSDTTRPAKVVVARNQILDTMTAFPAVARAAPYSGGLGYGAMVHGQQVQFTDNVIRGAGYDGALFGGESIQIERNLVQSCCLILDDCGGIYLGGGSHVVRSNVVVDMVGNAEGTASFFTDHGTAAQGIYPDDRTHDIRIEDNTVVNADFGIQVHNSYQDQIRNNHVYGCREAGLHFSEDTIVNVVGFVHDNVTEGNTVLCRPGAFAVVEGGYLGVADFGTFDHNTYWHEQGQPVVRRTLFSGGQWDSREYSLQGWRDATGNDLGSVDWADTYGVVPSTARPTGTANLVSNGSFDTAATGWTAWPATVGVTWAADCALTGGCLQFANTAAASGALVSSPSFAVAKDQGYQLRFRLRAAASDTLSPVVRRAGDPWESLGFSATTPVGTTPTAFTFAFVGTKAATGRLDFGLPQTSTSFSLDDVSLLEAEIFTNDSSDDSRILYNASSATTRVDLGAERWCAEDGTEVTGVVELAPFTSRILVSCFCNGDFECNNRETKAGCAKDCP